MANSITIVCSQCEKKFNASAEVVGKKVRCKACGEVFVAKLAGAKAAAAKATVAAKAGGAKKKVVEVVPTEVVPVEEVTPVDKGDDDDDSNPYGITDADTGHRCPHCANEMESEDSVVCLACGYNTQTRTQVKTRVVADQGFLDYALWLGPAIFTLIASIGLVVFNVIYDLNIDEWVNEKEWYHIIVTSGALKMWMGIITAFIVCIGGRYAILRLFFNYKPPEIEVKEQKR